MSMKEVLAPALALGLLAVSDFAAWAEGAERITLTVMPYPWVPDYAHIGGVMERRFEAENPGVDLVVGDQNWDYYEPGGLDAAYDIYEIDGIYLRDFVRAGRLQPLDPNGVGVRPDALDAAAQCVEMEGALYAVPHWICALYTFFYDNDERVAAATTREELVAAIGAGHDRGRGLLVDWKGHSTLAELYADCLLDLGLSPGETIAALSSKQLHPGARAALGELIGLSDVGTGRCDVAHKAWPPHYAREFAHGRGRALVGYSERMYHILEEIASPSDPTPVVDARRISVKLYNQGGKAGVPLLWVDSFAIDRRVAGPKLRAAERFLEFAVRDDVYRAVLLAPGKAPQYLLPAYTNLFRDEGLTRAAPLYPKFLSGLEKAASLVGEDLPAAIEATGALLDKELPTNLQRE